MKIITLHMVININKLYNLLQQKLTPLFHERRKSDIDFKVELKGGAIEINGPEIYECFYSA